MKKITDNYNNKQIALRFAFGAKPISILQALNKHGPMVYTKLQAFTNLENSGLLAFYTRKLRKANFVFIDRDRTYTITDKGKQIVKFYKKFDVKFISDKPPDEFCQNSKDYKHDFIKLCRNCSYIESNVNN